MAEGEATTSSSFSESNGDSLLSGSVRYLTDLLPPIILQAAQRHGIAKTSSLQYCFS